jgi:hypothetical protein
MRIEQRIEYVNRDSILNLLSDDEVASVATAEVAARLAEGDEYLDLGQLERGVQTAREAARPTGRVLPRGSVHANTWAKILARLAEPRG